MPGEQLIELAKPRIECCWTSFCATGAGRFVEVALQCACDIRTVCCDRVKAAVSDGGVMRVVGHDDSKTPLSFAAATGGLAAIWHLDLRATGVKYQQVDRLVEFESHFHADSVRLVDTNTFGRHWLMPQSGKPVRCAGCRECSRRFRSGCRFGCSSGCNSGCKRSRSETGDGHAGKPLSRVYAVRVFELHDYVPLRPYAGRAADP